MSLITVLTEYGIPGFVIKIGYRLCSRHLFLHTVQPSVITVEVCHISECLVAADIP